MARRTDKTVKRRDPAPTLCKSSLTHIFPTENTQENRLQTTLTLIILCVLRFYIPDIVYLSRRQTVKFDHMKADELLLPDHWVDQPKNETILGCCSRVPTGQPLKRRTKASARKLRLDGKKLKSSAKNTIYSIGLSFGKRTRLNLGKGRGRGYQAYRDCSANTNRSPSPGSARQ